MEEEKKYTIEEFKAAMRAEIDRWHFTDKKKWTNQEIAYYGFACAACLHLSEPGWDKKPAEQSNQPS